MAPTYASIIHNMGNEDIEIIGIDGTDKIIYSESFNIYEGKLVISNFLIVKPICCAKGGRA